MPRDGHIEDAPAVWGYVRVSQEGDEGIENQKQEIREYCRENGLELVTTRNDGDKTSGFDIQRHEYKLLRGKIETGDIDGVVTRDRARLSRDFDERLWLITQMRGNNVHWHVSEEGRRLSLEDAQQAMFECVHAGMDYLKKQAEIERSRRATRGRIDRGCYQGRTPVGLQFADDGCHLEKSDRWNAVKRALEMIENGHTYSEVTDETGITNVHKIKERGIEYYVDLMDEFGVEGIE